jgi:hypothetical protein
MNLKALDLDILMFEDLQGLNAKLQTLEKNLNVFHAFLEDKCHSMQCKVKITFKM